MNESKALRALADRIDELEALKAFPTDISEPGEVVVTWTEGKDHDGYEALSTAVSALVAQHWNALRSQVLKSKEGEVQSARNMCNSLSSTASLAEPGTTPAGGTDTGMRRFG